MISVLVPIADDSEEIETACITDTLVRAGADVTVASVMPEGRLQCKMSRGLKVVADTSIDEVSGKTFDAIALLYNITLHALCSPHAAILPTARPCVPSGWQ